MSTTETDRTRAEVELSVVAPARNEQGNLAPLIDEITAALDPCGTAYEVIIVDDASTDGTERVLVALRGRHATLRAIRIEGERRGGAAGQSAALHAGFRAARGGIVATLDADLQNVPADLPMLLERFRASGAAMVQGDRTASRRDGGLRRVSSGVGRLFRRMILGDSIRDTGCSLRVMRRDVALALPLEFRGMHRFVPFTATQLGHEVIVVPVRHRPRTAGRTKYGVWNRALPGLVDCFAVRWMRRRRCRVTVRAIMAESGPGSEPRAG